MIQVFLKEVSSFFSSLVGYVVMSVFLLGIGLITWVFPETSILEGGFAELYSFFNLAPYIFIFLVPAITMRSFADEKKTGTLELLFTFPLNEWQIIFGKYLAAWFLVFFSILPTVCYYYTVYDLAMPQGNVDTAAVAGSYLGLMMLASVFCAIGIFSSALTDNQIVSFILSVFLSFILFSGFSSLSQLDLWAEVTFFFSKLSLDAHYNALGKGLIDSRDVIYMLSVSFFMLFATRLVLISRLW